MTNKISCGRILIGVFFPPLKMEINVFSHLKKYLNHITETTCQLSLLNTTYH